MAKEDMTPAEMIWRTVLTIIVFAAFFAGSLIYVAFYPTGYTYLQKVVVIIVALVIAVAIVSIIWVTWALGKHK
ncbi:Uncharacterised protein [uncultured archaeon]|nr:Uncharacterised protein [uncultured archaeon]